MTSRIAQIGRLYRQFETILLVVLLLTMAVMATVQILLRNLFDTGLFWNETLLRALVLWLAVVGSMVATREDAHIRIDLLKRYLPAGWVPRMSRLVSLFACLICGAVAFYGATFTLDEYRYSPAGVFANWLSVSIIPVGFTVMALRFLRQTLVAPLANK